MTLKDFIGLLSEAVVCGCCSKYIVVLKNFANFTRKHLCWSLFLMKLQGKETPIQVFFYEIYEIFKNIFVTGHLRWLLCAIDRLLAEKKSGVFFNFTQRSV